MRHLFDDAGAIRHFRIARAKLVETMVETGPARSNAFVGSGRPFRVCGSRTEGSGMRMRRRMSCVTFMCAGPRLARQRRARREDQRAREELAPIDGVRGGFRGGALVLYFSVGRGQSHRASPFHRGLGGVGGAESNGLKIAFRWTGCCPGAGRVGPFAGGRPNETSPRFNRNRGLVCGSTAARTLRASVLCGTSVR